MEVARTSWYAQHYLARAPNLEKKVQTARRQYEPDTTCQQQVAAEAQELSKLQQLAANTGQARLTARQLATLTSEQLKARLDAAAAVSPPPTLHLSASNSTASLPAPQATTRGNQLQGSPPDNVASSSCGSQPSMARSSSSRHPQQEAAEVLQVNRKHLAGGGDVAPGQQHANLQTWAAQEQQQDDEEEGEAAAAAAEEEEQEEEAQPSTSYRESLAVLTAPPTEEPLVVEVTPEVMQHMRGRLSSITPRQPDVTGPSDASSSTSRDATTPEPPPAPAAPAPEVAARGVESATARFHRLAAPRTVSPPRTSPSPGHQQHPRAWSPPGTRRALSPAPGTQRALSKSPGGHPVTHGDTRPGVSQDQQQQQQRGGGSSRPGTGAGWGAGATIGSTAAVTAKPLGRWSAQRAAREQQRQQQLQAAGQLLSDIDTTLAAGRPASGRRGGEGVGSPPGTSGVPRPTTTGVQHATQQQQQQQQGASDGLVLANDCPPAATSAQQQQQGGDSGAAAEAVSPLLQASMVLRWQKFNTAAAGEAAANTAWLAGILGEAPKEEAATTAAGGGGGGGGMEPASSSSCSMGQQLEGASGMQGQAGTSSSDTGAGCSSGRAAGGTGGAPEQRRDLCHWPGALPGATHGHLSPDKLTFRALPGSKRQVYAQLADARACYHAIRTAGQALDELQLLQEHERHA